MARRASINVKPKVAAMRERRHLRPDEARALIAAAARRGRHPFRDKVLLQVIYRHGLRASEAIGLRWSALDLDHGTLHVERAKGGKVSTHTLDRDELRDLRKLRGQVQGLFVFETERGGPLSVDTLQYICREAGRLAGLEVEVFPHMLRHSAGYMLANQGHDTRLIQEFLGHSSISSTVRYTAIAPARLAAVRVR
jgi:integrase